MNPKPDHSASRTADQQEFLRVFLANEREIFRYVAALVPPTADAQELVQQTAVVLGEKFDQYDASRPFAPWACRFALNVTRQWLARRQRWKALLDGTGQSHQDAPAESAFFEDGSRGSFLVDLGQAISVTKINSYSWHQHRTLEEHRHRALQRFTLYGVAGDQLPELTISPRRAGWERIARVNTDRFFEVHEPLERPAQQACSITAARGEIGRFRYLLWVTFGGTLFGEFDVFGSP